MQWAYNIHAGGAPFVKKYQTSVANTVLGIPWIEPAAGVAGPTIGATGDGGIDNMVGVNLDEAAYNTAQQADGSDPAELHTLVIDPHAVFKCKISGGAASDTALTQYTVTTASTTGLDVVTGDAFTFADEGVIWGFSGANAGIARRVGVGDGTDATVVVAFPADTAVGDVFLAAGFSELSPDQVTLTTELNQIRADATATTAAAAFRVVELDLRDESDSGRTNSFAYLTPSNHVLGAVAH